MKSFIILTGLCCMIKKMCSRHFLIRSSQILLGCLCDLHIFCFAKSSALHRMDDKECLFVVVVYSDIKRHSVSCAFWNGTTLLEAKSRGFTMFTYFSDIYRLFSLSWSLPPNLAAMWQPFAIFMILIQATLHLWHHKYYMLTRTPAHWVKFSRLVPSHFRRFMSGVVI